MRHGRSCLYFLRERIGRDPLRHDELVLAVFATVVQTVHRLADEMHSKPADATLFERYLEIWSRHGERVEGDAVIDQPGGQTTLFDVERHQDLVPAALRKAMGDDVGEELLDGECDLIKVLCAQRMGCRKRLERLVEPADFGELIVEFHDQPLRQARHPPRGFQALPSLGPERPRIKGDLSHGLAPYRDGDRAMMDGRPSARGLPSCAKSRTIGPVGSEEDHGVVFCSAYCVCLGTLPVYLQYGHLRLADRHWLVGGALGVRDRRR